MEAISEISQALSQWGQLHISPFFIVMNILVLNNLSFIYLLYFSRATKPSTGRAERQPVAVEEFNLKGQIDLDS